MDKRVYFLMIVSFVIGMVELIIGGILDLIAVDLDITLGQAGLLITIFSLIFAIFGPVLLIATAKMERKQLTFISLFIFLIGNIVTVFSTTYTVVFIGRIISAMSGSLLIILCLIMAPSIVQPKYRGRAIGIVSMGISGSIALGLPVGLILGNAFGWRAPFILISILTVLSMVGVWFFMEKVEPKPSIPIREQLATLKNRKILFAQLTTFLFLAGHATLYTYFKPFLEMTMGLNGTWISVIYLIFGVSAVGGGGIGGTLADQFGAKRTTLVTIILFAVSIFSLPYATSFLPLFLFVLVFWGMLSWAITPAVQSYLIETSPHTSDIQQSLNNSALHFGIAFGSLVGGIAIENAPVEYNATIGGILVLVSLVAAIIAMSIPSRKKHHEQNA